MNLKGLTDALLPFLAVWSAQILILTSIAALGAMALRHPKARLLFWQGVLLLALLLPAIQPWKPAPIEAITAAASVIVRVAPGAGHAAPWYARLHWRFEYLTWALAAGAALRLLWIALGLLRLRHYRSQAEPLADAPFYFVAKSVRWYVSDGIPGPVTYGWLRPSILLPRRVQNLAAPLREAIACHELVHVRRGDWPFVFAEEIVRGLIWFHPAIWYATSQIQLAREQVVDREAVGLTENRDCYLDALIAVAGHKLQPDLAPATLFLKKRHLAVRVAEMMKEVSMSRSRIFASLSGVFSAALAAAGLAVWFFPMTSPAQTVVDDPGISVDAGGTLLHRSAIHYPFGSRVGGTVSVEATLNSKGEVTDAHVLAGPDELRRAALESVLNWHYSTSAGALSRAQISIKFDPLAAPEPPASARSTAAILPTPLDSAPRQIKSIEFSGISPEAEQELRNRIQVHEGDSVTAADMLRISRAVQEYDSHLRAGFTMRAAKNSVPEAVLRIAVEPFGNGSGPLAARGSPRGPIAALQTAPPPPPPPPPPPGATTDGGPTAIRVGGNVQSTKIVSKETPVYPPLAKQARVQGTVQLSARIGKDGTVENLAVISGHPLLVQAAEDAVKQWVYQPTLLNGQPVEVITEIDVNFTLSQ
jgi:TonB family protein